MSTKKTKENKGLKQLADALPPAYELHKSGGEKVGIAKNDEEKKNLPKNCILLPDGKTIWKIHTYKVKINHYKRLKKAHEDEGIKGVQKYLASIRAAQEERKINFKKENDKLAEASQQNIDPTKNPVAMPVDDILNKFNEEVTNTDTLGDG